MFSKFQFECWKSPLLLVLPLTLVLSACGDRDEAGDGQGSGDGASGNVQSETDTPKPVKTSKQKMHDLKEFTVSYNLTGVETGTSTEHWRNWGQKRVELKKTTISMMGVNQSTDERIIIDGPTITSIDNGTNTATTMQNPMYATLMENMKGKDPKAFGKEMLTAMGGVETGETREYAGEKCDVWTVAQIGATQCMTKDGIAVYLKTDMGGMTIVKIATKVKRGDGGPDKAFEIGPEVSMQQMPNLQDLMKGQN